MMAANKTMTLRPVAGGIEVVFTHTEDYTDPPTVTVTSPKDQSQSIFGPKNKPFKSSPVEGTKPIGGVAVATQTLVVPVPGPGTYEVVGVCTGQTRTGTVTVP